MADVNRGDRPLSPHLSVYRLPITAVTSILTRITGNAMLVAALMFVWWFLAASTSPEAYATADWFMTSFIGDLIMFFSLLGLWYHLLAGVRHLIWDSGHGFDLETATKLSWAVIIGAVVLTLLTLIIV
ncbi:succinate dehydrogenase, cytochrome b556 subunit [Chachezhania sediminis]|uniref:succinate dehydrogenase, cytochrome b556 subunit n=1 Tax=Chachezhania sediminis TaxID=2599291 RepID=UPI00131ABC6A|nr:succinate dehydrogenase, cytochrome b556 subunit [Chachezhania sediminis]